MRNGIKMTKCFCCLTAVSILMKRCLAFHCMMPSTSPRRMPMGRDRASFIPLDRRWSSVQGRSRQGPGPLVTVTEDPVATLPSNDLAISSDRRIESELGTQKKEELKNSPKTGLGFESTTQDVLSFLTKHGAMADYERGGVAVITGGSSGLGKETVKALAQTRLERIVLLARDLSAGQEVVDDVRESLGDSAADKIRLQFVDLADLASVERAVQEIITHEGAVDLICNNAGVNCISSPKQQLTKQGLELQIGVNHLAHYFLTRKLLPILNSGGRVVTVSSTAFKSIKGHHLQSAKNLFKTSYTPWKAYSQSKLANVWFAQELQQYLNHKHALSLALHPGIVKETNLWRHSQDDLGLTESLCDLMVCKSASQGAATILYACLVDESFEVFQGGDFLVDCHLVANPVKTNMQEQRDCWEVSQRAIERHGFQI